MTPDERLRRLEARLSNLYKDAEAEMREKWNAYFEGHKKTVEKLLEKIRNAKDDEAKKKATKAYLDYMKGHVMTDKYYKGMVRELSRQYAEVNARAQEIINGQRAAFFADGYNISADEINHFAIDEGIGIRFDLCDENTIAWLAEHPDRLLMPPPSGARIPEDEQWNRKLINSQMMQGIVQGESIPKIAKRLENVTDGDKKACIRRARTMATNAENAGRVQSMQNAEGWGVKLRKEWMCTHDSRTRHTHLLLDGEKIDTDDVFWNGCRWPGDHLGPPEETWNCRCTIRSVCDGFTSNLPKGKENTVHVWVDGEKVR